MQRAVADNPDLVQEDPAFLKLANKVSSTTLPVRLDLDCLALGLCVRPGQTLNALQREYTELRLDAGQGC